VPGGKKKGKTMNDNDIRIDRVQGRHGYEIVLITTNGGTLEYLDPALFDERGEIAEGSEIHPSEEQDLAACVEKADLWRLAQDEDWGIARKALGAWVLAASEEEIARMVHPLLDEVAGAYYTPEEVRTKLAAVRGL